MPVGPVQIVLDMFARREIALVILKHLDHWRPCYGRDIQVLRQIAWMRGIMSAYPLA